MAPMPKAVVVKIRSDMISLLCCTRCSLKFRQLIECIPYILAASVVFKIAVVVYLIHLGASLLHSIGSVVLIGCRCCEAVFCHRFVRAVPSRVVVIGNRCPITVSFFSQLIQNIILILYRSGITMSHMDEIAIKSCFILYKQ